MENKLEKNFKYLKAIINDKTLIKDFVEDFAYPIKAIDIINNAQVNYFLNSYYNLTTADILNMIDDAETLQEVKKNLYTEYKEEYASAWYNNFIEVLSKIKIDR